ncbi:pyridoxine 5'-phosphate synthase [Leptospira ognonensis]|uniref:Pyridoxine 5'-phosphate synthase n=1 Tax=Leptospira ognonensis TaxID=2484945 RepID=A0A4R9K1R4_9LEPT|nr:pyridoxine 5'-phosphate synthase [Leptospira ognonensis]TGL59091.1 pyridoxine 5'-phosphate synthase [Leptospira ognonensis]
MTQLSVNVNKIATLRNSRAGKLPSVTHFCEIILNAGAHGITVHPREDERHITRNDVFEIKEFLTAYNQKHNTKKEYNMEGEPSERFMNLVLAAKPNQVTLVPVKPGEITSDHGFHLLDTTVKELLAPIIDRCRKENFRVSLFMETDPAGYKIAKEIGADRIELYTGPFAHAFDSSAEAGKVFFKDYILAAEAAHALGLQVNAGHDLDTDNLEVFATLPHLAEVSIGHRLISRALEIGMESTILEYLKVLSLKN